MLRNKFFISIVLIGLAIVAYINYRTFYPQARPPVSPIPVETKKSDFKEIFTQKQSSLSAVIEEYRKLKKEPIKSQFKEVARNPFLTQVEEALAGKMEAEDKSLNSGDLLKKARDKPKAEKKPTEKLNLTAIIFSEEKKLIMIGDKFYKEGDIIGEETIKQINPYSVIMKNEKGEERTIELSF